MKKISLKQGFLVGVAVLGLASALPVVAQAIPARAQEAQVTAQERQEATQINAENRRSAVQTRLVDAKLKACQNREEAITNIMSRLSDRGQKQANLFSTIAERTEAFYIEKGKTLTNYDVLVADVADKKAAAQVAIDSVASASAEFSCDGDDPRGVVAIFKESLRAEIEALNAYKVSVKNLIVGVKSVQGAVSSTDSGRAN